ncbi:MAG TPA: nuclear transport factor 2 family protein, partial [Candidatus Bathyarchaeia archaeon]|nr:nuclear transport factor 2 family protein [Candidatus Bathyarchaeia archaeon]
MIRDTVQKYFDAINKGGWESCIADDVAFTVHGLGTPRHVTGKPAYVGATKRFLQVAKSVELKQLVEEGTNASAISSYKLQSPFGNTSTC